MLSELLSGIGNVLDTPGSFARALLAGDPSRAFSGVLDPEQRYSGRDLLQSWGALGENQEGFDAGDVAGFGAEMLFDPLNLIGGGLLAKAARQGAKIPIDDIARTAGQADPWSMASKAYSPPPSNFMSDVPLSPSASFGFDLPSPAASFTADMPAFEPPAFAGQIGRMTDTLAPTFYSPTERAIEGLQGSKFKTQSLPNLLLKGGAKPEEMADVGLREMLAGMGPVADKEGLLAAFRAGQPELKWGGDVLPNSGQPLPGAFSQYTQPGASGNYQNMLLHQPPKDVPPNWTTRINAEESAYAGREMRDVIGTNGLVRATLPAEEIGGYLSREAAGELGGNYKSPHWGTPNVIAHARTTDRFPPDLADAARRLQEEREAIDAMEAFRRAAPPRLTEEQLDQYSNLHDSLLAKKDAVRHHTPTPDAKRQLFAEELQSDLHQAGAKHGYKPSPEELAQLELRAKEVKAKVASSPAEEVALQEEWEQLLNKLDGPLPPDAPFKDSWTDLLAKKLIRDAAEGGYESVGWPRGQNVMDVVGGELAGQQAFYDQKLPGMFGKYIKKWGSEVKPTEAGFEFPVTPQMRHDVLYKGQPLYQALLAAGLGGGLAAYNPVAHQWQE